MLSFQKQRNSSEEMARREHPRGPLLVRKQSVRLSRPEQQSVQVRLQRGSCQLGTERAVAEFGECAPLLHVAGLVSAVIAVRPTRVP